MCRLFGFKSVLQSQVHESLVHAENALILQSQEHSDGWGVAYYVADSPHVIKSHDKAIEDSLFRRVSGLVRSQTVLAHLRKATVGRGNILNSHPFQHGRWVFAHNGNLKNFDQHRSALLANISESLRGYILGDTDSEILFFLILSQLKGGDPSYGQLLQACRRALKIVITHVGEAHLEDSGPPTENYFTFILSNGSIMMGFHSGKTLYFSTHKRQCSQKESCAFFQDSCETDAKPGDRLTHLLFASYPLEGENVWKPMEPNEFVGADRTFVLQRDLL